MDYPVQRLKWTRITVEQITYIKANADKPCRVVAKELGVSSTTVFKHVNGYFDKSFKKNRSKRLSEDRKITQTSFETNGYFDINKWANCSHV